MKDKNNFFYKTGVDICSMKSMFNFLNDHFTYDTMNSWNRQTSIANKVKVYSLKLDGDCYAALALLEAEEYETVNEMIRDWEADHPGYVVYFNGRSGGYLVLTTKSYGCAIPDEFYSYDTYEDWKEDMTTVGYRVSDFFRLLRDTVELVRDFDRLCDDIRAYVNELSKVDYKLRLLQDKCDEFNNRYDEDLDWLGAEWLEVEDGSVYVGEINHLKSLMEAFERVFDATKSGLKLVYDREEETYHYEEA